jgi:malonate-semialdehyde dehydrogenase (acetylating)/methylmalonate-semialdehyde dehydrogenase
MICQHSDIHAISFVGSNTTAGEYNTSTGQYEWEKSSGESWSQKSCHHNILDANRKQVVKAVVGAAFGAAGQRCMALSTPLVFVGSTKEWINDIVEEAKKLKVGPGMDPSSDLGPVITPESKSRVEMIVGHAVDQGAVLNLDGRQLSVDGLISQWKFCRPNGPFKSPNRQYMLHGRNIWPRVGFLFGTS